MNTNEIFDTLVLELRTMHNESLIRIEEEFPENNNGYRTFRIKYDQELEGRGRRTAQIHITLYQGNLSVNHYFFINSHPFPLPFPFQDPFVLHHLRETFREWVLHALTLPHHEREANFQAYLRRRMYFYAVARRLVSRLPVPLEVGTNIKRFLK